MAEETDSLAVVNERKTRDRARSALQANADYLANPSPTAADITAQVRLLTQEVSALIRIVLRQFDQ